MGFNGAYNPTNGFPIKINFIMAAWDNPAMQRVFPDFVIIKNFAVRIKSPMRI